MVRNIQIRKTFSRSFFLSKIARFKSRKKFALFCYERLSSFQLKNNGTYTNTFKRLLLKSTRNKTELAVFISKKFKTRILNYLQCFVPLSYVHILMYDILFISEYYIILSNFFTWKYYLHMYDG